MDNIVGKIATLKKQKVKLKKILKCITSGKHDKIPLKEVCQSSCRLVRSRNKLPEVANGDDKTDNVRQNGCSLVRSRNKLSEVANGDNKDNNNPFEKDKMGVEGNDEGGRSLFLFHRLLQCLPLERKTEDIGRGRLLVREFKREVFPSGSDCEFS